MQSPASFINDEWKSFVQLAWLDKRTTSGTWRVAKDFAGLPAWICKTVGGTTTHWAGASLRFQEHEFKARTHLRRHQGREPARLAADPGRARAVLRRAEDKMGVTRTHGIPGLPGNNNFKVMHAGARSSATRSATPATWRSTASRATAAARCMQLGFCFQGCKSGAKWSTLYTELPKAEKTGNMDLRPAVARDAHRAQRRRQGDRRGLHGQGRQGAAAEGARRLRGRQRHRDAAAAAAVGVEQVSRTGWPTRRGRSAATTCAT